jgi:DNA-binding NarL/FixJ family response regulator
LPARILIGDDHSVLRKTLRSLLESHPNWQVCGEAESGAEAVRKTAELNPDLVILDFAMPGMDGIQATRQICSAFPGVPVLIYTDHAFSPEAKLEARKQGVREIVNKGSSPDQLISAIEALIEQPQKAQDATPSEPSLASPPDRKPDPLPN